VSPVGQPSASATPVSSGDQRSVKAGDSSSPLPTTAPDLSSWRADGRPASVRLRDANVTHVTPLRGEALSAEPGGVSVRQCGARLQTGTAPAQSLILVGVGVTEALNCDGIKALGAVPSPRGMERIAFVYAGSSPNASGVNTIVIIESTSAAVGWAVNADLSYKLDQLGTLVSISAIRTYLAKHSQR
jgi:hypothetical protein